MNRLPILIYHAIDTEDKPILAEDKGDLIYISGLEGFEMQMKYLSNNNYHSVLLDEYLASNLPDKSITITFDDGHISNYTRAFPVLKKYDFRATFFITLKNIDSSSGLQYKHLNEMAENGMSIQSHTMTHPFLSDLSPQETRWELQESKTILEQNLGRPVDYLALPGGRCSSIVKDIAREAGYRAICTSVVGYNNLNSDPYSLKRWSIKRDTKLSTFASIVQMKRSVALYHETRYFFLYALKKSLGNRFYVALREKLL